jgi:hypothetical protein
MLIVKDNLVLDILINKVPLPTANGIFKSLFLVEGNGFPAPSLEMSLFDKQGILAHELALSEGNEIAILVGKSENDPRLFYRQYRYFTSRQEISTSGPILKIIGIYDAPLFFTSSQRESYEGTTSQVMKTLAAKSGLSYSGPEEFNGKHTNDNQIWRNIAKSRASFMRQLWLNGFIDPGSCMNATVTSKGELRYRNLNDLVNVDKNQINYSFFLNQEEKNSPIKNKYAVREAVDRSEAGLSNAWMNYGHSRTSTNLSGNDEKFEKIQLPSQAASVAVNSKVSQAVKNSRVDYSNLDCGNVHINYEQAKYQNTRLNSLFNQKLSILIDDVSDCDLFEPVLFHQEDEDRRESKNNGVYFLNGKTIAVTEESVYCERLELVRYETKLKDANLKTAPQEEAQTPVSSVYVDINPVKIQSISDTSKQAALAIESLKNTLENLQRNGPTLLNKTVFGIAGGQFRNIVDQSLNELVHFGGSGNFNIGNFQLSLQQFNQAYTINISQLQNLSFGVQKLLSSVGQKSLALRLSSLSQLPLSVESLASKLALHKIQDSLNRRLVSSLVSNVGLARLRGLSYTVQHNLPYIPGFPSIPSIPGLGNRIPGFPNVFSLPDFREILNTGIPGLPSLPAKGIFLGEPTLVSLPLPLNVEQEIQQFSLNSTTFDSLLTNLNNNICSLAGKDSTMSLDLNVSNLTELSSNFKLGVSELNPPQKVYTQNGLDLFLGLKQEIILASHDHAAFQLKMDSLTQ